MNGSIWTVNELIGGEMDNDVWIDGWLHRHIDELYGCMDWWMVGCICTCMIDISVVLVNYNYY